MTDTEIREAIARACGWEYSEIMYDGMPIGKVLFSPDGDLEIPDYPNDLNDIHSVLCLMVSSEWMDFEKHLTDVLERKYSDAYLRHFIVATPRELCEAFLRVKGLWKEDE